MHIALTQRNFSVDCQINVKILIGRRESIEKSTLILYLIDIEKSTVPAGDV